MQEAYPLLRSYVREATGTEPYFELREQPWKAEQIYRESMYGDVDGDVREWIMREEWKDLLEVDYDKSPQWTVTAYHPSTGDGDFHLALTASHVISDGQGTLRLNQLLLNEEPLQREELSSIPSLEERIDTKPSIWLICRFAFLMMSHKLPSFLRRLIQPHDPWLGEYGGKALQLPTKCSGGVRITTTPADVLLAVKAAGKARGIPTVHSIIFLAYLTAIWSVYRSDYPTAYFRAQMPMSERDAHPDFAHCTTNYVAALVLNVLIEPQGNFFDACKRMYGQYTSEAGIKEGRQCMGITGYMPNKQNDPSSPTYRANRPTSWEDTLLNIAEGSNPYTASVSFSNLARVNLPENATSMCWSVPAQAFQPPLTVDVIGHEGGIEAVTTWMEGAGMTGVGVEKVVTEFARVLRHLAQLDHACIKFDDLVV